MTAEIRPWQQTLHEMSREFTRVIDALNVILELDRHMFAVPRLDELLTEVLLGVQKVTHAQYAQILLRRGSSLMITNSTIGIDVGQRFDIENCVSGLAVKKRDRVVTGDVQRDYPDLYKAVMGSEETPMRSEVVVPIVSPGANPAVIGVLNVESPEVDAFKPNEVDLIEQFAWQAGGAIHMARLREVFDIALDITNVVHAAGDAEAIREPLHKVAAYFPDDVTIQFLLKDGDVLTIEASTAPSTEKITVRVDESFCGEVVRRGEALLSNDVVHEYPTFQNTVGDKGGIGTKSELAVPIRTGLEVIGVVNVESPYLDAFSDYDKYILSTIAQAGVWQQFRDARRNLALGKMAAVGDAASNLVHVLNNGVMTVYLRFQKVGELVPQDEAFAPLRNELAHIKNALTHIYDRAREIEARYKRAIEGKACVNINDLARRKAGQIVTGNIQMEYDFDESIGDLTLPSAIEDVLENLLSNAKASIPSTTPGRIEIRTKLIVGEYTGEKEALEIHIADNGKGIPPEKMEKLFELGESDSGSGHLGFGLWWLSLFVERYEGTIKPLPNDGGGTRFVLRLPLTPNGAARGL
jgi:signal transduction histidine kinase